ncbi:TetR/AcrR family transcriptional regulator [Luteibacter aegosomatissinici]|uniref:TetR/AcrR family transcriptional regulator n=1 Tax=Luteibacter aegosomatissinici TaxID=2911539 RepID=UPI001FF9D1BE|nr:TetR/AcrR family transcriptional regulator [Luteibacter aegosomatissinici]UPG96699.1 TetR/AcrR family transcriptional regulator [Luteibacter aegosomatissinici]
MLAEAFRELGYDGASMARITEKTGLGKGSLYHFFPGGKEEMAAAVLADVDTWFETRVFSPLATLPTGQAIRGMWTAVDEYFHAGGRVCLVGAFALDETRDRFGSAIGAYFGRWIDVLTAALERGGERAPRQAALEIVGGIQGALTLARALNNPGVFVETTARLRQLGTGTP